MRALGIRAAKTHLRRLVEETAAGEEIVITRGWEAVSAAVRARRAEAAP
jgi:antitoxin (DNA-binding transcriptional repressor) of toxin-antitoxin stability system